MMFAAAVLLVLGTLVLTLLIRPADLPEPIPESPTKHLEDRKAIIYESLRDLAFEYRVGKLSDEDYQKTKQGLQAELAAVLAEIDRVQPPPQEMPTKAKATAANAKQSAGANVCPHCKARFAQALKFCGECGKPMSGEAA